jgi:tetratricopeptide (TPR) repeat protein
VIPAVLRALLLALCALAATERFHMAHADDLPDFDSWWDYGDVPATEVRFRGLLPKAEAAGDADYTAGLLSQIARTEGLQGRFAQGHETLDRAEKLLTEKTVKARVRCLLERGRLRRSAKEVEASKPLFSKAWELARAARLDGLACDAGHMMGLVEPGDAGLEWNLKTIAFAETSKDPAAARWIGTLSYNTGWAYHDKGEYEKALALFRKDLAFRLERKAAAEARVSKWSVARALRSLKRVDEALALQRELEKEYDALPEKDGYVFEEIAECLTAQGKTEEAVPYFARAHALLKDRAESESIEASRIERMRTLGRVK